MALVSALAASYILKSTLIVLCGAAQRGVNSDARNSFRLRLIELASRRRAMIDVPLVQERDGPAFVEERASRGTTICHHGIPSLSHHRGTRGEGGAAEWE
jgi:hypothetical protein